MNDAKQKVWLITGCSTGLGRALAETVLKNGATVAATARSVAALNDLKDKYPDTCLPLPLDVTDRKQCEEVVQAVVNQTQRLDVLVNNAGYGLIGSLEESADEQIQKNFATIVFGAIHLLRAACRLCGPAERSDHQYLRSGCDSNYAGFSILRRS